MPRITKIQNSFVAGQITPKLSARTDVAEYQNGVKLMKNMMPYKSGGAMFRPAFRNFDTEVGNQTPIAVVPGVGNYGKTFRVPFIFSKKEAYLLRGAINGTGFSIIAPDDVTGASITANTSAAVSTALGILDAAGEDIYGFHYAQSNDVLMLVHNSGLIPPIVFMRLLFDNTVSPITATFEIRTWEEEFPFIDPSSNTLRRPWYRTPTTSINTSTTTIASSAKTIGAGTVLTASAAYFTAEHVGAQFYLVQDSETLFCVIDSVTGPYPATTANATVRGTSTGYVVATADETWYESAWSNFKGWPQSIGIFEGRLLFGNTVTQPNALFGSDLFNYFQMNRFFFQDSDTKYTYDPTPTTAQAGFEFTISSNSADGISYIASGRNLIVGTLTKEYVVTGGQNGTIAPLNVNIVVQTSHGGSPFQPAQAGVKNYFISRDQTSIIEFGYSQENGSYTSKDLSIISDEIIHEDSTDRSSRFVKIVWQESRDILWALTNNKNLYGITLNESAGINAWFKVVTDEIAIHEINSLPNSEGTFDDLLVVTRAKEDTIEFDLRMVDNFEATTLFNVGGRAEDQCVYLDMAVRFDAISATTTFPMTFIAGVTTWNQYDTVTVFGESGTIYTDIPSDDGGGNIVIPSAETGIWVGIEYTGQITCLNQEFGGNELQSSQGDITRFDRATLFLYKTWAGQYGDEVVDTFYDFEIDSTSSFTGRIKTDIPQTPDDENFFVLRTSQPLPMNILGIVFRGMNQPV